MVSVSIVVLYFLNSKLPGYILPVRTRGALIVGKGSGEFNMIRETATWAIRTTGCSVSCLQWRGWVMPGATGIPVACAYLLMAGPLCVEELSLVVAFRKPRPQSWYWIAGATVAVMNSSAMRLLLPRGLSVV